MLCQRSGSFWGLTHPVVLRGACATLKYCSSDAGIFFLSSVFIHAAKYLRQRSPYHVLLPSILSIPVSDFAITVPAILSTRSLSMALPDHPQKKLRHQFLFRRTTRQHMFGEIGFFTGHWHTFSAPWFSGQPTLGSGDMCVFLTTFCCLRPLTCFNKHSVLLLSCPVYNLQSFMGAQLGPGFAGCCNVGVLFPSPQLNANVQLISLLAQNPVRKGVSPTNVDITVTRHVFFVGPWVFFCLCHCRITTQNSASKDSNNLEPKWWPCTFLIFVPVLTFWLSVFWFNHLLGRASLQQKWRVLHLGVFSSY